MARKIKNTVCPGCGESLTSVMAQHEDIGFCSVACHDQFVGKRGEKLT